MSNPLVYSPSMLKTYMSCPYKFKAQSIDKSIKWQQSPAAKRGEMLHALMETGCKNDGWSSVTWTDELSQPHAKKFLDIVSFLKTQGWQCQAEVETCTDGYGNALDWWAKPPQALLRSRIDFLAVHPDKDFAIVMDWKTGKKYECDKLQLQVNAVCLEPIVKRTHFKMGFAYLDSGDFVSQDVDVKGLDVHDYSAESMAQTTCSEMMVALRNIQQAVVTDNFPKTKNRFCRWCQCAECPMAGK